MSNVGREYGRQVAGKAFRLVIVGMSHAGDGGSDFFEPQRESEKGLRRKVNSHHRGVLKMAAALLGEHGCECDSVKNSPMRCTYDNLAHGKRCALMAVAQPNLAKCAGGDETKCVTTLDMYRNCSAHLLAELEVLNPTILVFQTAQARSTFPVAVNSRQGWSLSPWNEVHVTKTISQ